MRTSEEIYHRVRWDPRFDPARFTLGILVRGAPTKRVALPSFVPGGEIPWHRVLFIEADGEVVWDRAAGVDRLDDTVAGRARGSGLLPAFFSTRDVHGVAAGTPGSRLRVLTWNTLWDRYNSAHIDTARRRPLLLDELARADADVIALQEVEPALYDMLALDGYAVSGMDVGEHGLVLLSRLPVLAAGHHVLSPHKGIAAMVVRTAAGPVAVLATHLTSDHHPEGPQRRARELARLVVGLDIEYPVVLLGDFNGGAVAQLGLVDAWTAVHDDETPTFDPAANPLAALSSPTGQAGRLDRVLVRGVRPVAAELLGTTGPVFVSDHYGVSVSLDVSPDEVPTALAWRPALRGALGWMPDDLPVEPSRRVLNGVVMRVASALGQAKLDVVGSRRMQCENPGADLDIVAVPRQEVDVERIVVPGAERTRRVVGARVPGLRFRLDGVSVDLTVVSVPRGMAAGDAVERREELAPGAAVALSAVSDADAVCAAVRDRDKAFSSLAMSVKAWAAARGLDSAPHGGLPGIAWAVLAARTVREAGGDDLLAEFFGRWAAWDWREPVTLLGEPAPRTGDPMTVLTPTAPVRSCTSQVGAGMRDHVSAELYAAWETVTAGGDPLPAPAPHRRHAAWAVVTVTQVRGEKLDVTVGRLRGRVRALLDLLPPDAHAWPAPFDETDAVMRFAIGLGVTPPSAGELAEAVQRWGELPGVHVEWVTNSTAT